MLLRIVVVAWQSSGHASLNLCVLVKPSTPVLFVSSLFTLNDGLNFRKGLITFHILDDVQ